MNIKKYITINAEVVQSDVIQLNYYDAAHWTINLFIVQFESTQSYYLAYRAYSTGLVFSTKHQQLSIQQQSLLLSMYVYCTCCLLENYSKNCQKNKYIVLL